MARAKKAKETTQTVRAIKGFDADMRCRGFQFEVGKTYDHKGVVECCSSGFHACDGSPMDVWGYYGPVDECGRLSRYAAVSMAGAISREGKDDSKLASGRITIEAEITLPQFVKKAVDWLIDATKGKDGSGDSARIGSSGNYARIGSSGNYAQIGSSGNYAQIGSSGNSAQIGSSGNSARIGSSGNSAQIGSSGNYAQIGSSGNSAQIVADGKNSVVAAAGAGTTVSGAVGLWISIAEFRDGKCVGFATGCIGQDGLEAGVPYIARGGKLVPAS